MSDAEKKSDGAPSEGKGPERTPPTEAEASTDVAPYLRISILTGFPEMFTGPFADGMLRIAQKSGKVEIRILNLRDFTDDPHRSIDDYPYGGGPGMILKIGPVVRALESLPEPLCEGREVLLLTPQGERLDQPMVRQLLAVRDIVLVIGRYKGVDERVRSFVTREVSIGDYVLSGGEPAAIVIADCLARLVPGVMGDIESAESDSFERTVLDSGYYTRPEEFRGLKVPEVYLSGHHARIAEARREDALQRTWSRRPDLLEEAELTPSEEKWLAEQGWSRETD